MVGQMVGQVGQSVTIKGRGRTESTVDSCKWIIRCDGVCMGSGSRRAKHMFCGCGPQRSKEQPKLCMVSFVVVDRVWVMHGLGGHREHAVL
jgi:hypothetical protein